VDGGGADDESHADVRCFPLERVAELAARVRPVVLLNPQS
jgi:hypothetical protein